MPDRLRRKLHPKLRAIRSGSRKLNDQRAERCAAVRRAQRTESLLVNVFVYTTNGKAVAGAMRIAKETPVPRGRLTTMTVPIDGLETIAAAGNVSFVELGQSLAAPTAAVSSKPPGAPDPNQRKFGKAALQKKHRFGANVLIGIIDVGGFDFSHPDFLAKDGTTRWISIWDQGAAEGKPPGPMNDVDLNYGHVFGKADLDRAIAAAAQLKVPAWALERQSQTVRGSHGTHVASIAAGNHGICRKAQIAGVLLSLQAEEAADRRRSFYDSTRLAHAVDYLVALAKEKGLPLSINISLGTNGHAHDGTSAISRWIENAMTSPGRVVSVAAGNAGQQSATSPEDLGWIYGRIHTSGRIAATGLARDIEWTVAGDGITDVSENELEIWYSPQDRFDVMLRPPSGGWIGPVAPGRFVQNRRLADKTRVSIYNEIYNPSNGANYIAIFLSPNVEGTSAAGIASGQWTVRLIGKDVRDGRYHGWIERDDVRAVDPATGRYAYPSYFSESSNVDDSSVGSLACGARVLSVANLDEAREMINITSSQGPTRDGRSKPDVAAPGTDIVAANGFAGADDLWLSMSGTSMASPYMCGVAGLMLNIHPDLNAAQIEGIVQRTAKPLPGAAYEWANDHGFGQLNPLCCLTETVTINDRKVAK